MMEEKEQEHAPVRRRAATAQTAHRTAPPVSSPLADNVSEAGASAQHHRAVPALVQTAALRTTTLRPITWRPAHANTRGAGRHVLRCVGWGRARRRFLEQGIGETNN